MPHLERDFELGEIVLIVGGIAIVAYFLNQLVQSTSDATSGISDAIDNALGSIGLGPTAPKITGTASWIGDGNPLTAAHAESIANQIMPGSSYKMSPDGFQVWFPDGSFYDNRTGHVYDVSGKDKGPGIQVP